MAKIKIEGFGRYTPKWETLQQCICEMFQPDGDKIGRLIKIHRTDGKCGYRDLGLYELYFLHNDGSVVCINLEVV